MHITHTSRNQSRGGSHISYKENTRSLQLEIDRLRRRLCRKQRRRTPSDSNLSFNDKGDGSYKPRSKTPPSESFSYDEDCHYKRRSKSPCRKGLGNDAISRALSQISKSSFTCRIEGGKLPRCFAQPTFTMYNGRTDPVEHVSHFNQRMAVHSKSEALMCKVFQSSLGPVAMRWFDDLKEGSINSVKELTRAFRARFVTCSRIPWPLNYLLSMAIREGKTLKTYSDRYCEIFNEIDRDFNDVAIRTFKVGLPVEYDLRKSLTRKPVRSVRRLMDRIDEYKRVEEDQQ